MKNKTPSNDSSLSALKREKRKRAVLVICLILVVLPLLTLAIGVGGFAVWANTQAIDASLLPTASALPTFYDIDGNILPYAEENYVDIKDVGDDLKNAFIALEDKRFYSHKGYDTTRMAGAMLHNIKAGGIREGASTITQQLIKNTHLTNERTLSRKLKELALAIQLEKDYSKDEILSMYLSVIYFGSGAYGVKQASKLYFDKSLNELTLAECATLAGIVRNPSKYSPIKNPEESLSRRNVVLTVMAQQGYIDESELESAKAEPLINNGGERPDSVTQMSARVCEFYIAQATKEVCKALNITKYQLSNSGYKIYTNLNSKLQYELEKQKSEPTNFEADGIGSVSIVLDNSNGAVLAYSSSYPYEISRQAGSVLKPLAVYAPAIDCDLISLATPIVDESINFNGFAPNNYGGIYYGDTNIKEAVKKSMNSVSVKVLDYLGVDKSVQYLQGFGISTEEADKNYALALGATSKGVNPLSVGGGYMTLARGGEYIAPSFVRFVAANGSKILSNENEKTKKQVLSSPSAALTTVALREAVTDGTSKTLSVLPFEVAAKTGTVKHGSGNSDAWNVSYNDSYTVVVWHGSDSAMSEKGGGYPTRHSLKIWQKLQNLGRISPTIKKCDGIVEAEIDVYSTNVSKHVVSATQNTPLEYRKTEYFKYNSLPSCEGSRFDTVGVPDMKLSNENGTVTILLQTEKIYDYEIYRTDSSGSTMIYATSNSQGEISLKDKPISLSSRVDYTVVCHLVGNEEISSTDTKSVYITDGFAERWG